MAVTTLDRGGDYSLFQPRPKCVIQRGIDPSTLSHSTAREQIAYCPHAQWARRASSIDPLSARSTAKLEDISARKEMRFEASVAPPELEELSLAMRVAWVVMW